MTAGAGVRDVAAVTRLGTILGVWAHPDDETYLSGGLMASAVDHGQRVTCVTATAGEQGTDDPVSWPPTRLAALRSRELADALHRLGVHDHRWLGYPDGGCAAVPLAEGVGRIAEVVEDVRPDTILTFGPDGLTGHADHVAVGQWARAAAAVGSCRVLVAAKDVTWLARFEDLHRQAAVFEPGHPWTVRRDEMAVDLDLPDEVLERKLAALEVQASQTAGLIALVGRSRWREWIRTETFADPSALRAP